MNTEPIIDVIIPALNEEQAIQKVINDLPPMVRNIIVVDNNSKDKTGEAAKEAGAQTLLAREKGYGNACLTGINHLKALKLKPDIVVFIDGDYADFPEELPRLIAPITEKGNDLVIGSRLQYAEKGSLTLAQKFGNRLATFLLRKLYNTTYTDLGPFRAIKWQSLMELEMQDKDFGWTVEMQLKAAKTEMRTEEVPVRYRPRIGKSKVSGTIKGTILAGYKIIYTIFKYL